MELYCLQKESLQNVGSDGNGSFEGAVIMKRLIYGGVFLVLLMVEVLIAVFVHDDLIRPYVGDMLVVIVVYCFVRIFMPVKCRILPLYVFLFAVGIEILQYFQLVQLLGLEENKILRILLGSVFDVMDILCYAIGCVALMGYEGVRYRIGCRKEKNDQGDCVIL